MRNKLAFLSAAGLVIFSIIVSGCSTEKPWTTNPTIPFSLAIISGPADSLEVPADVNISFNWMVTGGSGEIQYQYRLNSDAWSALSNATSATLSGLAEGVHTFTVHAQDGAGHSMDASNVFEIVPAGSVPPDTLVPVVTITESPAESSFVATGATIVFTWEGSDEGGSGDFLLYQYTFAGEASDWLPATTVTFANVAAADPAVFEVMARDASGNVSSSASLTFVIKNASILYVDDYQWLDSFQNIDRIKEREQKAFYREVLRGYAFAEWEVATQGMPDSAYIITFSTVVFASDSYLNDASDTWWTYVGDPLAAGGGVLRYYMENGGHLLAAGASILRWIYNSNPPSAGDFEYDWFGLDTLGGWDFWDDFTWAVKDPTATLSLPDSMKIDVGKNGDQVDFAEDIFGFRDGASVLFRKGLDIGGAEPADYDVSVGHIYYPNNGPARSALINFDAFSMPLSGIQQTFHSILDQFGEGPGI